MPVSTLESPVLNAVGDGGAAALPSVLVAIASYGRKQDHYLEQVLAQYRKLSFPCRVVVLTEAPKPVAGAEVAVGLPSRNPYSLPFAHRRLFLDNADRYDLFIYTEDDTLLTPAHVQAFLDVQRHLREDEILGFLRSETSADGRRYITSVNHHFRWRPESVEMRGGELFAQFSNEHSGLFVATRPQLARAIASGGFMVEPHDEMYGMLESAASDIYRQCGLRRVLCVSRIHEFILPHLANKYFDRMGVSVEELDRQVRALRQVYEENAWRGSLCEPQTGAYSFRWSKNLYATPSPQLLNAMPAGPGRVLSVGATDGQLETRLKESGHDVYAVAIDAVFARTLEDKGVRAAAGTLQEALASLAVESFDVVILTNVLHLAERPAEWLLMLRARLAPEGRLIIQVPNTGDLISWARDARSGRPRARFPRFSSVGAHPTSRRVLRRWCGQARLSVIAFDAIVEHGTREKLGPFATGPFAPLVAESFLVTAQAAGNDGSKTGVTSGAADS